MICAERRRRRGPRAVEPSLPPGSGGARGGGFQARFGRGAPSPALERFAALVHDLASKVTIAGASPTGRNWPRHRPRSGISSIGSRAPPSATTPAHVPEAARVENDPIEADRHLVPRRQQRDERAVVAGRQQGRAGRSAIEANASCSRAKWSPRSSSQWFFCTRPSWTRVALRPCPDRMDEGSACDASQPSMYGPRVLGWGIPGHGS